MNREELKDRKKTKLLIPTLKRNKTSLQARDYERECECDFDSVLTSKTNQNEIGVQSEKCDPSPCLYADKFLVILHLI